MSKKDITLFNETLLTEQLKDQPAYRIKQIFQWLWTKPVSSFDDFTNLPKELRLQLSEQYYLPVLDIISKKQSTDKTIKVGFSLIDKNIIEGVLIPERKRVTACISSQVGCNVGCRFCATGTMGFYRNLSVGEIIFQVKLLNSIAEETYHEHLSNLVFMGMGEPLLNYKNVISASTILTSKEGLAMSPRRITVSTVGIIDKITQMANEKVKFNLAVSLHAADEIKRKTLMPINKKFPLPKLRQALEYFHQKTGNRITIEYLLMKDINDSLEDAHNLTEFTKAFPCKINLIEFNHVEGLPYQRSDAERFENFSNFLKSKNLIVMVRRSRGKDIDAACGQLAVKMMQ